MCALLQLLIVSCYDTAQAVFVRTERVNSTELGVGYFLLCNSSRRSWYTRGKICTFFFGARRSI